jgi:multidrug resistance protein, MATE family
MMIAASIYHCIILYILVIVMDFGILGCSWGTVITYFLNSIVITVYCGVFRKDLKESYFWPNSECFEDLWDYFKMGLPSCAMLSLEFWSNEVQVIMASMLGIIEGGSMVIMINILTIIAMVPSGFHATSSIFVGNSLGEGNPHKAKSYQILITVYAFFVCLICSTLLILYKDWVAALFTTDLQLLNMVS